MIGDSDWQKSSFSSGQGGACVEVAHIGGDLTVRDSKNPEGPALSLSPAAWAAFTAAISRGQFG